MTTSPPSLPEQLPKPNVIWKTSIWLAPSVAAVVFTLVTAYSQLEHGNPFPYIELLFGLAVLYTVGGAARTADQLYVTHQNSGETAAGKQRSATRMWGEVASAVALIGTVFTLGNAYISFNAEDVQVREDILASLQVSLSPAVSAKICPEDPKGATNACEDLVDAISKTINLEATAGRSSDIQTQLDRINANAPLVAKKLPVVEGKHLLSATKQLNDARPPEKTKILAVSMIAYSIVLLAAATAAVIKLGTAIYDARVKVPFSSASRAVLGGKYIPQASTEKLRHLRRQRQRTMWLIRAPMILSAIFTVSSAFGLYLAPQFETSHSAWDALKDIGPTVAGFWVLSAALLTLSAAGFTIRATAEDNDARRAEQVEKVREACVGEILAFSDRLGQLKLHETLEQHLNWLRKIQDGESEENPSIFRRLLGDDWFMLARLEPLELTVLGEEVSARYLALSSRARHLISRLTYMNSADYAAQTHDFWIRYHADTLEVLNGLLPPAESMIKTLKGSQQSLRAFTFAPQPQPSEKSEQAR